MAHSLTSPSSPAKNGLMWCNQPPSHTNWAAARKHLRRSDPVLDLLIRRVGPCTLTPRRDYFVVLCKAIFTQQISTTVAAVLFNRFRDLFPGRRPTPARVIELLRDQPNAARGCGLSRRKTTYILDLAEHFVEGRIPTRRLSRMDDESVITALNDVKGIGRWTAEMFLIFTLNRPDVLPVDDFGLRKSIQKHYELRMPPDAKKMMAMSHVWRPYRSIATWYFWRGLA